MLVAPDDKSTDAKEGFSIMGAKNAVSSNVVWNNNYACLFCSFLPFMAGRREGNYRLFTFTVGFCLLQCHDVWGQVCSVP